MLLRLRGQGASITNLTKLDFFKYSGNGNDFVILDNPRFLLGPELIQRICDRRFGVGADGVLVMSPSEAGDARMKIFNADGGEAEMCGNGLRCLVTYLDSVVLEKKNRYVIQTMNAVYVAHRTPESFSLEMNDIHYPPLPEVPGLSSYPKSYFVDTGVPHLVLLCEDLDGLDVKALGAKFRYHPAFPMGANVNFLRVTDEGRREVSVRTYERGVEDETFSCGTGLTASALALRSWYDWADLITMRTKGGRHFVQLGTPVTFWGEVTFCFKGEYFL